MLLCLIGSTVGLRSLRNVAPVGRGQPWVAGYAGLDIITRMRGKII
jgi:hypothetical protein